MLEEAKQKYATRMQSQLESFQAMFRLAGFKVAGFESIPNQYCRTPDCCPPWYRVTTESGVIEIGWRKRVMSIDWSATQRDLLDFFYDDVTKDRYYIHAWTNAKAVEYLAVLRGYLGWSEENLTRARKDSLEIKNKKGPRLYSGLPGDSSFVS